jgi:hypothetical protein
MMMDVAFFDEGNPIMEWLSNSRSESTPILDEYDDGDDDWTMPGGFVTDELQMDALDVAKFKRKLHFSQKGGKKKWRGYPIVDEHAHLFEDEDDLFEDEDDCDSDSLHGSPVYAESQDSSSDNEGECELIC